MPAALEGGKARGSNEVILELLQDIDGKADGLAKDYRLFREEYIRAHENVVSKADAAHNRLDKLEPQVEALRACQERSSIALERLANRMAALTWVLGLVGAATIAWLVERILTGV